MSAMPPAGVPYRAGRVNVGPGACRPRSHGPEDRRGDAGGRGSGAAPAQAPARVLAGPRGVCYGPARFGARKAAGPYGGRAMGRGKAVGWILGAVACAAAIAAGGCGKKNIDPVSEVPGAVRWYAGITAERLLPAAKELFEAAGYRVVAVDDETGRVETDWTEESAGGLRGWRLTRYVERQKFIAHITPSQLQTDKGEGLVSVLLQLRWEERPPGGQWRVKEDGGAPSQSPTFQKLLRELDDRAVQLGGRRA